ncbi:metalloendopeptidase [Elysia marginata]|uniref:Metalloendopeptidase n=1 Tax=Elysia marginata TaxID=1093978 RepID=A0AAV4FX74_9GAST|nr:metalloendopeptidase [Elysia marginata]
MPEYLLWLRILILCVVLTLQVTNGQVSESDESDDEGVVEQYTLARTEVENELEEFYLTAAPGDEFDMHSDAMENLQEARQQLYEAGLPPRDVADLTQDDPGLAHVSAQIPYGISRQKRVIRAKLNRRWIHASVPYVFTNSTSKIDQNEIIRSMRTYERFTCIRFIPWSEENGVTTNNRLGLDHDNYLSFRTGGGCWSYQGNRRILASEGGQKIACCGGYTCVHEIGHALGESHQHQSPHPDRNRMIRINFDGIKPSGHISYQTLNASKVKTDGYDLSSLMHYTPQTFRVSDDKQTFYKFFPELPHKKSFYYMMREVSQEHKCQDKCSDSLLTCENDGYLTLVGNRCYCQCIPGLDPQTGCTTTFKNDPEDIAFPGGKYAIPAHSTGCPDGSFILGSRTQINEGKNYKKSTFNIGLKVSGKNVEQKFCIHDSPPTDKVWPGANLCLYRRGGKCPDGFTEGFVQYNDLPTQASPNTKFGELPDGVFDNNTRFEYCCADTGFSEDNLLLPSRKPFVLIKRRGKDCQNVRGMHIEVRSVRIGNANDGETSLVGGDQPMYKQDKETKGFWTAYCNYKPAMIDCGEVIDLNSSKTEVTISSPKAPELECSWLIKAPVGERLQLDFSDFNIKGKPGRCIDNLEVSYVRPGQPGINFCGPQRNKTTISIYNTIRMRLSTYGESNSHFTAIIKLVKNDSLCYEVSDRGMTYDGDVNFTRDYDSCLPWAKVSHCEMHPFKTDRFNTILQGNKCRNPDQSTGFEPWCFVKAENCIRGYCDVCQIGKRYDSADNCAQLKASSQCTLNHCAKTCADQYPQPNVPVQARDVRCIAPGPAPDGAPVVESKRSYAVGEVVKYKCDYSHTTKLRYCLSSGKWSSMGTACSECPEEFDLRVENQKCYFFPNIQTDADDAYKFCHGKGGFIAFPTSQEENVLLKSFTPNRIFLGISDLAEEGRFVTHTGDTLGFTKWSRSQPDNYRYSEDCVEMFKTSTWNDLPCTGRRRHFICQANRTPLRDCLDFSDNCAELFIQNPIMCKKFPTFAEKHCRYTCGYCGRDDSPSCNVSSPGAGEGDTSELAPGESITRSCDKGLVPVSGDEVRGCQRNGNLTGKPLECTHKCPGNWTLNPDNLFCYRKFDSPKNYKGAQVDCVEHQGKVATAADRDEQAFVFSMKGARGDIWLGLTDSLVEGTFRWADNKLLSYTNWKYWEPDNYGKYGEDCVHMSRDGKWKDANCVKVKLPYVCKVHVEVFAVKK